MRIVLVSLNFSPEPTGIGKYSGDLALALAERGHEVRVVCAPPYYPAWRVGDGYSAWRYRTEMPAPRLTVLRCPLWVPRRPGGVARLWHLASFSASCLPVLLLCAAWRPSVVMVVAPAIFSAPGAWLTALLAGARAWLHVQDFELDASFALGLLSGSRLQRIVAAVEAWMLRRFHRVSTVSERMRLRLVAKGVRPERSVLLLNAVDTSAIAPLTGPSPYRAEIGLGPDQVLCLFSGTLNRKQGLHLIVAAAERLRGDARIVFLVCGEGVQRAELESVARTATNLRLLPLQPVGRLGDLLAAADIHLLPQSAGAADLVMPSKLGGMLASGRPVVATAAIGTEVESAVEGRGIVVPPEDLERFVDAIRTLADDAPRRQALGRAARLHAEQVLDRSIVLARLDRDLAELAAGPPIAPVGRAS